jgi:hypothetical protein
MTCFILLVFLSCGREDKSVTVAWNGSDKEYLIHMDNVKDTLYPKLSDFAEDFEFIPLETKEECLVNRGEYFVTEKYILFKKRRFGILQFDRSGRFIRTLARYGQGPNEYTRSGWTVDEKSQTLYMAASAKKNYFLRFNLNTGEYLGDLKKAMQGKSTNIEFTPENSLLVNPFAKFKEGENEYYLYEQDLSGELLKTFEAPAGWFNVSSGKNLFVFDGKARYELFDDGSIFTVKKNRLVPFISFDFGVTNTPDRVGYCSMIMEYETNDWVVLEKRSVVKIVDDIIYFESTNYIFDKKEEKVYHQGPIHFDPTHQGIYDGDNKSLSIQGNGIIHFVYQSIDFIDQAKKALEDDDFTEPYRFKLKRVAGLMTENDNPVVVVGRLLVEIK